MEEEPIIRIKSPGRGEVLGIIESMLGSNRMMVRCQDNKMRICRIPGKMRKRIWMREGDAVIVKPWDIQGDKSGDVVFKYTPTQAGWLKKRGILKINY
jgi:translation initiation factor 1A